MLKEEKGEKDNQNVQHEEEIETLYQENQKKALELKKLLFTFTESVNNPEGDDA